MSKTYHFIGIKGSGMSALALMLHQMGHKVQGSDVEKYYFTQRGLEQAGIPILPFDEKNITEDVELIAGNAFREDNNVEIAYAIKNGYKFKRYHEFLGHFMNQFTSFGVAGAHGKTSTTGLLSHSMKNITDTSYLIGDGTGFVDDNCITGHYDDEPNDTPPEEQEDETEDVTYTTVEAGEGFWQVAGRALGDPYRYVELAEYNEYRYTTLCRYGVKTSKLITHLYNSVYHTELHI